MITQMTDRQKALVRSLMTDPEHKFDDFLKWLADSREATHQMMYTSLDQRLVTYLQGEAKTLFDVVNACNRAFDREGEQAIPPLPETPGGS